MRKALLQLDCRRQEKNQSCNRLRPRPELASASGSGPRAWHRRCRWPAARHEAAVALAAVPTLAMARHDGLAWGGLRRPLLTASRRSARWRCHGTRRPTRCAGAHDGAAGGGRPRGAVVGPGGRRGANGGPPPAGSPGGCAAVHAAREAQPGVAQCNRGDAEPRRLCRPA
jgi:hypothetical protein